MKIINEVKMNMQARSVNESFARAAAAVLASQADPTVDVLADIKTAISEAVTNAVVHAYPKGGGRVYIMLRIVDGDGFLAVIGHDETDAAIERIAVGAALSKLSEREQKLLLLRYYRSRTQQETAVELCISQVQASRIEKRELAKLKEII